MTKKYTKRKRRKRAQWNVISKTNMPSYEDFQVAKCSNPMVRQDPRIRCVRLPMDIWVKISTMFCNCYAFESTSRNLLETIEKSKRENAGTVPKFYKYKKRKRSEFPIGPNPGALDRDRNYQRQLSRSGLVDPRAVFGKRLSSVPNQDDFEAETYRSNKYFYRSELSFLLNRPTGVETKPIVRKPVDGCTHTRCCAYKELPPTKEIYRPPAHFMPFLNKHARKTDTTKFEMKNVADDLCLIPEQLLLSNREWARRYVFESIEICKQIDAHVASETQLRQFATGSLRTLRTDEAFNHVLAMAKLFCSLTLYNRCAIEFMLDPSRKWCSFGRHSKYPDLDSLFTFPRWFLGIRFKNEMIQWWQTCLQVFSTKMKALYAKIYEWRHHGYLISYEGDVYALTDVNPLKAYVVPCFGAEQITFETEGVPFRYSDDYIHIKVGKKGVDRKMIRFHSNRTFRMINTVAKL